MGLATKAARGAGAPAGQAADFGRAALCHLIASREAGALSSALNALPTGAIIELPLHLARAAEDAVADDAPIAFAPRHDVSLAQSYVEAHPFAQLNRVEGKTLHLIFSADAPAASAPIVRVSLPDDLAEHMHALAAKILVPETAASRLSGAGAGLTDND